MKHQHACYHKNTPLWQWIIIIAIVIAMPMFFSYYNTASLNDTLQSMKSANTHH